MARSASRRVIVTQRFFDDATLAFLHENACEVVVAELPPGKADGDFSQEELAALLKDADGWIVGHARVTRPLLEALPRLQVIARRGVGYERVDVGAAHDLGRVVTIGAGGNDASVADHTIGLMIAVARRFRETQANMIDGNWSILMGADLFEKTVGVIGLGRIGRSVAKRLAGFEAKVLACVNRRDEAFAARHGVDFVDLQELLARSDYVSVHAPLTAETRFMISAPQMAAMKTGAFLINTARGGLVEDAHLLDALRSGHLGGAGLDVFVSEADPAYKAVSQALIALPNVIATPHSGASSREGLDRTNMVAARSVVAVLDGGDPTPDVVVTDGRIGR
jgi:D-3-phosphoglycerate dehydrogenase